MSGSFPIGVSNELLGESATVFVADVSLLLLCEDKGNFYQLLPQLWPQF